MSQKIHDISKWEVNHLWFSLITEVTLQNRNERKGAEEVRRAWVVQCDLMLSFPVLYCSPLNP